jgi:pimeloyl-ACP methyl ester carboxylesterase
VSGRTIGGTAVRETRRLRWRAGGTGSPTLVLAAGIGAGGCAWDLVFDRLAEFTAVVTYDRAGYGGSGPGDASAEDAVLDLEAVLGAAGVTGPLVVVGHSWGGVLSRLYTARHPDRVAAVVLVDATHEDMTLLRNPVVALLNRAAMAAQLRKARRGTLRRSLAAGRGELGKMLAGVPEPARTTLLDELADPGTWEQARRELRAVEPGLRSLPATLPDIPVVAVIGTRAATGPERRMRAMTRAAYEAWLPTLAQGRLVEATNSGHAVPQHDPDLLVEVLRGLVTQL